MPLSRAESETNTHELLPGEDWENKSRYCLKFTKSFSSPQEIAEALLKNPGRFRSPLSLLDRLKLKLYAASGPLDFFNLSKSFFFVSQNQYIPYEWQVLLRYLSLEGMIERPEAVLSRFGHDHPKVKGLSLFESAELKKNIGFSNAEDIETMLSKAVGELLERIFLSDTKETVEVKKASVDQLKKMNRSFLHPEILSQFSEEQKKNFSRFRFREDDVIDWIKGRNLFAQKEILLPAQCVFRSHNFDSRMIILRDPNSNGCAGHFTLQEAVLAGIYENVERDAFLIYWLNSIAPPVIDIESIENEELQNLITQLKRYHFEVKFLNTTTDIGIPSFLCVLIDRSSKGPRVAVGGGSGYDIYSALLSGTREASSVCNSFYSKIPFPALKENYRPFSDRKIGRDGRILLWQNPEMFSKIEPFLSGKKQILTEAFQNLPKFRGKKDEYEHVLGIFRRLGKGYEVYAYKVRHRVLSTLGYHVVKIIIPEIVHLYLNEVLPPLGARRLKEVPKKLGYTSASEWNPLPHPFP